MITAEQIHQLATKSQTNPLNIAREYCQHLFLANLYQQPFSENLQFKGGTALKIVFNSPRYSEDLDFSGVNIKTKKIETLLINSLQQINQTGVETELTEAKTTSGGYLAKLFCRWNSYSIPLNLEISLRRSSKHAGEIFTINSPYLPAYTLTALNTYNLVKEKIQACLERQKPRDFFDIYFLLRSRLIQTKQKSGLKKIQLLLNNSSINFGRELKIFLPISFHPLIKNFKETLRKEFNRFGV